MAGAGLVVEVEAVPQNELDRALQVTQQLVGPALELLLRTSQVELFDVFLVLGLHRREGNFQFAHCPFHLPEVNLQLRRIQALNGAGVLRGHSDALHHAG